MDEHDLLQERLQRLEDGEGLVGLARPHAVDKSFVLILTEDEAGVVVDHVVLNWVVAGDGQRRALGNPGVIFLTRYVRSSHRLLRTFKL